MAVERAVAVAATTATVAAVATVMLPVTAAVVGLDDGLRRGSLWYASAGSWALALVPAAVTFGVGAATGSKGAALGAGAGLAAATYVLSGIAATVGSLSPFRWLSPWLWFVEASPLTKGLSSSASCSACRA